MTADRERLVALLTVLDASPRCLERDWQITGKRGHVLADGTGWVLYVTTAERDERNIDGKLRCYGSSRRWTFVKRELAFAKLKQDGDDEGCFFLDRLPTSDEAEAIRDAIGLRKRRHLSPNEIEARKSLLAFARIHFKSAL